MADSKQKSESAEPAKRTVYPYYSVDRGLALAEIVRDHGGVNGQVPKSLLAQHMKTEETSPTLNGVLGAAKLFNLVDGRGSYQLTETAKRFFYPVTDQDQRLALIDMVNGPPLFRSLIKKFDGTRLPPQSMLINLLSKEFGISESWRVRAATLFLSSIQRAGLIDSAGFLRYSASIHAATSNGTIPAMNSSPSTSPVPEPPSDGMSESRNVRSREHRKGIAVWDFSDIHLESPEAMTLDLWNRLNQYVQILKPTNGAPSNEAGRQ